MKQKYLLLVIWLSTSAALITGMSTPLFSFTRFYIFNNTVSLFSGVFQLLREGEWFLFILIFCFSVLFPLGKMLLLLALISGHRFTSPSHTALLKLLHTLGRWSMLDVFVVAVMAVTIKLGAVASVQIHYGLYIFTGAILASMALAQMIAYEARKKASTESS